MTKADITLPAIATIRLASQQLSGTKYTSAKQIMEWMGAMQAQDNTMCKWAIGTRLPGSTEQMVEEALANAEIIRTHLLRPTWHLVSANDIYWMLALTAPQIKNLCKPMYKTLELSEPVFTKSNKCIEKALTGGKQLAREALLLKMEKAGIVIDQYRAIHLLLRAELDGIICSGITTGLKQTYALLAERVPKAKTITNDDALAKLAYSYFASHSPASLLDFTGWSGLPVTAARNGLEMVKKHFVAEMIEGETYWFSNSFHFEKPQQSSVHLLPAFDEFIIGYKNRRASLPDAFYKQVITNNGIFRPVVVVNGQVTGLWKRVIKKDIVQVDVTLFKQQSKPIKEQIKTKAEALGTFLGKKTIVSI